MVPVVNENDAVADEEIRFGDNDRLAALVANLVGASRLVLLTDTEGLLTADPRLDDSATLIEEVGEHRRRAARRWPGPAGRGSGSGGMASKLAAARMATWSGVTTVIAPARAPAPVSARARAGEPGFGTTFTARPGACSARKAWIAFAVASRGDGAASTRARARARARRAQPAPRGRESRDGDFVEGDAVEVVGSDGEVVAKGLVRVGRRASSTTATTSCVHRDDLVLLRRP